MALARDASESDISTVPADSNSHNRKERRQGFKPIRRLREDFIHSNLHKASDPIREFKEESLSYHESQQLDDDIKPRLNGKILSALILRLLFMTHVIYT
jgi:hypothetical protein